MLTVHDGIEQTSNYLKLEVVIVPDPEDNNCFWNLALPANREAAPSELVALFNCLEQIQQFLYNVHSEMKENGEEE